MLQSERRHAAVHYQMAAVGGHDRTRNPLWQGLSVREPTPDYRAVPSYESEGSEGRALGSIKAAADARWLVTLSVPMPAGTAAFVELERRGDLPAGYRGSEERAFFSLPIDEIGLLVELLAGVIDQARRDGVLPDRKP